MSKSTTICAALLLIICSAANAVLTTDTVTDSTILDTGWLGPDATYNNWTQTWTFDLPPAYINSATLDIVAFDVSVSQGDIIPVTLDSINLGNLVQGNTNQWNTNSFSLSSSALAELIDGSATISVTVASGKQIKIKTSTLTIDYTPSSELIAIADAADKALNAHDLDLWLSYLTDDAVFDYVPLPTPMNGKEEIRAFFADLFVGFPDIGTTEGRVLGAGNIVVVEHSIGGTHTGVWQGIPPTGNTNSTPHIDIYEFEGDKIKRMTSYLDVVGLMIQLGLQPAPDMPDLIPSIELPNAEPSGLAPLEANSESIARWNSHDMTQYAKMLHTESEIFAAPVGVPMDRNAWVAMSELYFQIFSGANLEVVREVDMGDGWILTEEVSSGIQNGPFFGVPPSGREVKVRAVLLNHFDQDGVLTNMSYYFDNMTIVEQITLDVEADIAAINELYNQATLAVKAGDVELYLSIFTEDAVVMATEFPPMIGKEVLRPTFEGLFGQFDLELPYKVDEVGVTGNWAFGRSSFQYSMTPKESGETTTSPGKQLDIFKRQADGSWKIYIECWNYGAIPTTAEMAITLWEPGLEIAQDDDADTIYKEMCDLYTLAVETGDIDLYVANYTDDGVQMPPDEPSRIGSEQILAAIEPALTSFNVVCPIYPQNAEVTGDWAFGSCNWSLSLTPKEGGETTTFDGKGMDVLKRQADGSWKYYISCWNYNGPPTVE